MHRIIAIAGLMLLTSGIACAASCKRVEVSGAYNYYRPNTTVTITTQPSGTGSGTGTTTKQSFNLNGWNTEAAVNATCWLGIVGDFTGVYGTPIVSGNNITTHVYNSFFGPRFSYRNTTPVTPFVEAFVGVSHASLFSTSAKLNTSSNAFGGSFGGGVDITISKHMAFRTRGDYVVTTFGNATQSNASVAVGIVLRFLGGGG
jgi:hypothetical protein